jgi:hypothetical protein
MLRMSFAKEAMKYGYAPVSTEEMREPWIPDTAGNSPSSPLLPFSYIIAPWASG